MSILKKSILVLVVCVMVTPAMMFAQDHVIHQDGALAITACDGSWWSYTVWHWTNNVLQASVTFYRDGGYLEGEFAFIEWIVVDPMW